MCASWISPRGMIASTGTGCCSTCKHWVWKCRHSGGCLCCRVVCQVPGRARFSGCLPQSIAIRPTPREPHFPPSSLHSGSAACCSPPPRSGQGCPPGHSLPIMTRAPPGHQPADDSTVHLRTRPDIRAALAGSVHLYCQASAVLVEAAKAHGFELGDPEIFPGLDTESGSR
jgi:hypothetical protein